MSAPPPAFDPASRERNLERLREGRFDVLILGGGINGAGIARDLGLRARRAGRNLRIGLVEQRHFASGASGRNSQLLHGGLRYLKNLEIGLVREALGERAVLRDIAPHLVDALPFLIPMYGWFASRYYGAGLWLYDLLAGGRNIGRRRYLTREQLVSAEPDLETAGLTNAAIYFDCRVQAARFLLENLFDAARDGVLVANYAQAGPYRRESDHYVLEVSDALGGGSFPVRARKLVDARGPWEPGGSLRLVRGSHIILPRVNSSDNAIAHFGEDGRILFVIPWGPGNRLSLVGTTDVDHPGGPDDVRISADEVRYLMRSVRRLFPGRSDLDPIAAYSSLRPLAWTGGSASSASREHRIWNNADGVVRIAGGKYTTYRLMSHEAVDLVTREMAPELTGRSETAQTPLGGNSKQRIDELAEESAALAARHSVETAEVLSLVRAYGIQAPAVLELLPGEPAHGLSRVERAMIGFAARHEMARRLPDLLFVSTYWGYEREWNEETRMGIGRELGRHLGWSEERIRQEAELAASIAVLPDECAERGAVLVQEH